MSLAYRALGWNRQKRLYDLAMASALLLGLVVYGGTVYSFHPDTTAETFVIRFSALAAVLLLHVILAIGPLVRLDSRFLPLLYNRRHLGVMMFLLALLHGSFAIVQFHAGGNLNPLISVLTSYRRDYLSFSSGLDQIVHFPFEALGLTALLILFVMAATSHDFWLRNLGPSFWKTMHMLVYLAYALLLAHVFLGAFQSERNLIFPLILGIGFAVLLILHGAAFAKEFTFDRAGGPGSRAGFVLAAKRADLVPETGKVVVAAGKRIALFLHDGRIFALSNVCQHQGGPLGEGRIVAGCLTCPWHGYQYQVEDGHSPPPFTEGVPTYEVRLSGEDIYVSTQALPLGTKSRGAIVDGLVNSVAAAQPAFYIGWQSKCPAQLGRHSQRFFALVLAATAALFFMAARFQNPVDPGTFEFGGERTFAGTLLESPLPILHVPGPGDRSGMNFLLVGSGKFGASHIVRRLDRHSLRFTGSLIHRNGMVMIQMSRPESLEVINAPSTIPPPVVSLGRSTFRGELVDTKCFLGVMRPATGKVHRACAVRCLSGGAPPALLVRDEQGHGTALLLAASPDQPLDIDPELAARTLEVQGSLELHSGLPILRVHSWRVVEE